MKFAKLAALALGTATLAACATAPGPVEVTRFHDASALSRLGNGTIFIEAAPGEDASGLEMAPYKAAIARQLTALGYRETTRAQADQIAQVSLDRYKSREGDRRGPVSVGVGGSTGSYGSGLGVGVGLNLGGGAKDKVGTDLAVAIKDKASGNNLWEGRAQFAVAENSDLARTEANAQTVASALFREFPGGNGETVEVGVK
ncbi:DUF4136 domain-containing protein [Qipengyuania oceanensis]|uniref:DUF4136 domain-containing protein n=1 Tax=Qipengyuania oceanensis TaxID=1463597 RepID=A0A844YK77_9SPHN|nr:DUF4136 domain-containing protein [Qipengyuania oceanensis]MXO63344.1 DUF4136 domain-containing protein [Qipengyuania oceanensis]